MGHLIAIEGLDGSGKNLQATLLDKVLREMGYKTKKISFPDYASPGSTLVKMYLRGEIGASAEDVNAYAASSFYAVDRYVSFETNWKSDYNQENLLIADRYTTSNIIYQLTKLPDEEKADFIDWIEDYEYSKLGLPKPDLVIYLDMEVGISQELMKKRYCGDASKKDIHESNVEFLNLCRENALFAAKTLGWSVITCFEAGRPREIPDIHQDVMEAVKFLL